MIITSSIRQGFYIIFILLMVVLGTFIFKMPVFQILLIIALAGIIVKLTDIEEKIERLK